MQKDNISVFNSESETFKLDINGFLQFCDYAVNTFLINKITVYYN